MSAAETLTEGRVDGEARRAPLRRSLQLDAVLCGTTGLALVAGAPWLDGLLGAPAAFLAGAGAFLLAYTASLVVLLRRGAPAPAVWVVIAGNVAWAVASVAAVVADWLTPTTAGTVIVLAQAGAVALLAEVQALALRRAR